MEVIYISCEKVEKTGIGEGFLVVVNETVTAIGLFRFGNELEIENI